ncbi:MAG: hypothetical protein ACE37N_02315 [Pseudohongiellaceae bacterium]
MHPGDDFFRYANGRWLDTFELPESRSNYGSFTVLSDRSDERSALIDDLSDMNRSLALSSRKSPTIFLATWIPKPSMSWG